MSTHEDGLRERDVNQRVEDTHSDSFFHIRHHIRYFVENTPVLTVCFRLPQRCQLPRLTGRLCPPESALVSVPGCTSTLSLAVNLVDMAAVAIRWSTRPLST